LRAYRELKRIGCIDDFEGYPPTALPPQYDDLLNVYLTIKTRQPTVILEIGGGYSTLVIARAVSELTPHPEFWSVDLSKYWQDVVRAQLPEALRPFVRFHHGIQKTKAVVGDRELPVTESLPVNSANLVYIDGGDRGDAILLEQDAPDDYAILVDGREKTVEVLKNGLAHRYRITPGPFGVQTLFTRLS
jgi:hypothetical protein